MSLRISKKQVVKHITAATTALGGRTEEVNKLNVFPIADNDTGNNLYSTVEGALKAVQKLEANPTQEAICKAIVYGAAMGARGNSGVILSNITEGFCKSLTDNQLSKTNDVIVKALEESSDKAWRGCAKPKEGTILSTIKDMAKVARDEVDRNPSIDYKLLLRKVSNAAFDSAKRTPELLEIHKKNGVIDAGSFGLVILTEAIVGSITGKNAIIPTTDTFIHPNIFNQDRYVYEDELYHYEIVFQFDNQKCFDMNRFIDYLSKKGGSIQVAGDEPHYKIHVHTDSPQNILAYAIKYGEVVNASIENLVLQLNGKDNKSRKKIGVVTVASGDGIIRLLEESGADKVVQGGQSMNPSVEDLVSAIDSVNAESIIFLPNNKNIMMAAEKAIKFTKSDVRLLPTTCVQQAIAALAAMITVDNTNSDVLSVMQKSIADVTSGEITFAVKDAVTLNGTPITERDLLGLLDNEIAMVSSMSNDILDATEHLIQLCLDKREREGKPSDMLTILTGCDLSADYQAKIQEQLSDHFKDLEICLSHGNQPLYPIILSIE